MVKQAVPGLSSRTRRRGTRPRARVYKQFLSETVAQVYELCRAVYPGNHKGCPYAGRRGCLNIP